MDPIYLIIVIILLALASLDLIVGVANDAVNFLNSSIGSKVAPLWVILTVASVGVLIGAVFSSGMMEVARSGVFHPEKLTFHTIMLLFLAVMITDVILLDLFNTFGLPTSTTVSLVFELLGAAVAVSLITIYRDGQGLLGEYINSSKALAIIGGIFISIAVAFIIGAIIMYISRIAFSFKYQKSFRYLGGLWGGIALTSITYFAVFKGLKNSSLMSPDILHLLNNQLGIILLISFAAWTVIMLICQFVFKINILKIIVLAGTLALALAFAGNDLVNFIGVFMAGLDSYKIAAETVAGGGSIDNMYMSELSKPVAANTYWLLGAGAIMVLALWFSKKSRSVTETEVNLARKGEGIERFSSSALSRSIVRGSLIISTAISNAIPQKAKVFLDKRFEPVDDASGASFDLIRASVNLTVAALLISLGTSLKLPLSTTYVTFMVAMGSSLADRAWGRESAVYRINGVLTVVGGWLMTAIIAFAVSSLVASLLMFGGKAMIFILLGLIVFLLIKSSKIHTKRSKKQKNKSKVLSTEDELIDECVKDVENVLNETIGIFETTLSGLETEDRKLMKKSLKTSDELYELYKEKRQYEVVPTLEKIRVNALDLEQEYVQLVDYSYEITKSLKSITESSFAYIDNNHKAFTAEQVADLRELFFSVKSAIAEFTTMMKNKDFSEFEKVTNARETVIEKHPKLTKKQIRRVKDKKSSTRSSILFLSLMNEIKIISLQTNNLLKSERNFIAQYKKVANEPSAKQIMQRSQLT